VQIVKTNDANRDGTFTNKEEAPEPGSAVPFQLVITNTSSVDVTITDLTDAFSSQTIDLLADQCSQLAGTTLTAGESVTCTFALNDYSPPATASAKVDTAEVCVTNGAGNQNACDQDDSAVTSAEVLASTITPPPTQPPTSTRPQGTAFTGLNDTVPLALAALLMLLAGSGLLWLGARRSRSS
jgi:hypothetical protein